MMRISKGVFVASVFLGASTGGCITTDSKVLDATEGCDEYAKGSVDSLEIAADAKAFVSATADIDESTLRISEEVLAACAGVALDLGQEDSWSAREDLKDKISNAEGTGACDKARSELEARLSADAEFALRVAVSEGECRVNFEAQRGCEASCEANPVCEPGTAETRCEPGKISAYCEGGCAAEASCVGTVSVAAQCEGACAARAEGQCTGKCFRDDGTVTENDAACVGKCEGELIGACYGQCKVTKAAGLDCGAEVRCRGGCMGQITAPTCTTEYAPPTCEVDTACYEACSTRAAEEAECDPTTVTVLADFAGNAELEAVANTLEKHLAVFYKAAKAEGALLQSAGKRIADSGRALNDKVDDLEGKALACIARSVDGLSSSLSTLDVSIQASVDIKASFDTTLQ